LTLEKSRLLDLEPCLLGGLLQADFLGPREESLAARPGRGLRAFAARVGGDAVTDLVERRQVRLGPLEGREQEDRIVGGDEIAHLALPQREGRVGERLHAADAGDVVGGGERRRLLDRATGSGLGERLAAHDLSPVCFGLLARELERPFAAYRVDDLVAHGIERLRTAGLVLFDLDDMETEGSLDDVAHLAGLEREGGGFERRRHRAAPEEPEVAALGGRARVVRVLARERRKIAVAARLREQVLRLLARGRLRRLPGA